MTEKKDIHLAIFSGDSLGLENDSLILKNTVTKLYANIDVSIILGKEVLFKKITKVLRLFLKKLMGKKLIFIHMEELQSALLWMSEDNYLIPNQEWFRSHTEESLRKNTKVNILCKTFDAMRAFSDFGERCYYLGFASLNRYQKKTQKDFTRFLHLAGKSEKKGTLTVIEAWKKHPEWPMLTLKTSVLQHIDAAKQVANIRLITNNLSQNDLLQLMNSHGVHLCISEVEGFGHYIVEALSVGAIVVTTNAAPMNELVTKESGFLVESEKSYQQYRAECYKVKMDDFEKTIQVITLLSEKDLLAKSHKARERYLAIEHEFTHRLHHFFERNFAFE